VKATHDSRTNRHYQRTVLYRPLTKQPQATCISCYTPANLVAISWAWHCDWTSVSGCLFEKRYIYPTSIDAIPQNRLLSWGFFNLKTCSASWSQLLPSSSPLSWRRWLHPRVSLLLQDSTCRRWHIPLTEIYPDRCYSSQHESWVKWIRMSTRIHLLPPQWYDSPVLLAYNHYPHSYSRENRRYCHIQPVFCRSRPKYYYQQQSQELPINVWSQVRDPTPALFRSTHFDTLAEFLKVSHSALPPSITWVLSQLVIDQRLNF